MQQKKTKSKPQSEHRTVDTMLEMSDVAVRLNISLSMAYKLVGRGEIASHRFGRCLRVSEARLKSYIDDCLVEEQETVATRVLKYF